MNSDDCCTYNDIYVTITDVVFTDVSPGKDKYILLACRSSVVDTKRLRLYADVVAESTNGIWSITKDRYYNRACGIDFIDTISRLCELVGHDITKASDDLTPEYQI